MSRVLVLDDDTDIRTTVVAILESVGHTVDSAGSCEEALSRIDAASPDVIILDMRLAGPGADGADGTAFAEAYRRRPGPHAALVLFTALPDARELADRIGASAVLSKPFHLRQLLEVVERFAAGRRSQSA